jgi:photosystem II stability/assembly factor-like uncharacterized protein
MREPIQRRAPSIGQAGSFDLSAGRINSLSRQILTALGLAGALVCLPAGLAQAEDIHATTQSAVMSPRAPHVLLIDVAAAGSRLVAVGSRGHIVYSDDQGETWQQAPVPTRQLLTAVYFVDETHGWAVGHDSLILHSSDAGASWSIQYRDPDLEEMGDDGEDMGLLEKPLMDVWFRDTQTGFAVGAYGLALRTDDGGQTWDDISFDIDNPDGFHYNALGQVGDEGLFLVGEMGTMYRSFDLGDTWETIEDLPYDGSLFGVSGTGEPNVLLVWGLRGNMFRSEDFGDSWDQVRLMTPGNGPLEATLSGGSRTADGSIVVVGAGGTILVSKDRGRNFQVTTRPDRVGLASAKILDNGNLVLVGQRGAMMAPAAAPAAGATDIAAPGAASDAAEPATP